MGIAFDQRSPMRNLFCRQVYKIKVCKDAKKKKKGLWWCYKRIKALFRCSKIRKGCACIRNSWGNVDSDLIGVMG